MSQLPGGTPSSVVVERMFSTSSMIHSMSDLADTSIAASGSVHLATIKSYGRSPIACHNSSVTKGMNGWSITRIWSKAQAATARVSSSKVPFTSSTYQSQKVPQVKW